MNDAQLPAYLMSLEIEQLEQIHNMLLQRLKAQEQEKQQQQKKRSLPPAFHDLDSLAANAGLDLSGLMRDIKRRS